MIIPIKAYMLFQKTLFSVESSFFPRPFWKSEGKLGLKSEKMNFKAHQIF